MSLLKLSRLCLFVCLLGLQAGVIPVLGQEKPDSISANVELGEVIVGGTAALPENELNAGTIRLYEKEDLSTSMNLLPGVLSVHGTKTDMVYVRGFDQRQVPVYYDGVPIYIPYDGYIDLSMLMSNDVSKISVASNGGTLQYGPNALGGAINIVTAKPKQGFSAYGKAGAFTNGKYNGMASLGYGAQKYYLKASYAVLDKKDYRLSNDYEPTSSIEDGGDLDNSWRKMSQLSLKAGFTPAEGHEYALSYVKHNSEKGIPPYLGTNGSARYWQFPVYDKESVYFLSKSKLSESFNLNTRLYYDKFDNTLESYNDNTYTTQTKGYAFTSIYDDYTLGGIATLSYRTAVHLFLLDAQYKYDNHKEHNVGDPVQQMTDESASLSLTDTYSTGAFNLHGGLGLNYEKGIKAEYLDENDEMAEYPDNTNTVLNGEFSAAWQINSDNQLRAAVSYKTRFPTMKDRYSMSFGKSLANIDLKAENSLNYSLDYSGSCSGPAVQYKAGLFYSRLTDAILAVYGVDESDATVYQLQNTGKAEYFGGDFSFAWKIFNPLLFDANYSYVRRNNLSSPNVKFIAVPEHSVHSALTYSLKNGSFLNVSMENYSDRYSSSDGVKVDGFTLVNCKTSVAVYKKMFFAEGGVNNLFDKDYQVSEGYPMPGRNAFASLIFNL